eukprot:6268221-Amphidinium_carterae.1
MGAPQKNSLHSYSGPSHDHCQSCIPTCQNEWSCRERCGAGFVHISLCPCSVPSWEVLIDRAAIIEILEAAQRQPALVVVDEVNGILQSYSASKTFNPMTQKPITHAKLLEQGNCSQSLSFAVAVAVVVVVVVVGVV